MEIEVVVEAAAAIGFFHGTFLIKDKRIEVKCIFSERVPYFFFA